ncbi:MAG: efflux RND transporter permease subunit, partial [Anaerolineae bacterium]|nr:efflux RND transporter permease subunit [Anaerolineae bacterium]
FAYLVEQEPTFYRTLGADFVALLQENNPELYETLPEYVTSPRLGEAWTQLSTLPTMSEIPLYTVYDLNAIGAADTLNQILEIAPRSYAIELMNSLTPEALTALVEANPDFLAEIKPEAVAYLSREALETEAVQEFIEETADETLAAELTAILEGGQTAAESIQGEVEEIPADPNAPPLPASWESAAGFVGASELDTADDALYRTTYAGVAQLINDFAVNPQGRGIVEDLTLENWLYFGEKEAGFWDNLSASSLGLIQEEIVPQLPTEVQNRILSGGEKYSPQGTVTRTNGNPSLVVSIYKVDGSNTVNAWEDSKAVLEEYDERDNIEINEVFEQATFITESLEGVQREGTLGAFMAIIMILLFMNLSIRSTAVTSVSIPASIMLAFVFIRYVPGNIHELLAPIVDDLGRDTTLGSILEVMLRLFPKTYTLNIMTLSGMTVAIGRVVDDSIVVLENIYRNIQHGENRREAIIHGTSEVSIAILAATATTMVVFMPLGLFGGVVGAFFLPFGLAVTYALAASYIVAVTLVPALADVFITRESIPTEGLIDTSKLGGVQKLWAQLTNIFISGVDAITHVY